MKTKIISMLFAMVLVVAMLASCNGGSTDNSGDNGSNNNGSQNNGPVVNIPDNAPSYGYTWEKTKINFELTKNSSSNELASGCERYYAGTAANAFDPIDTAVRNRNLAAAKQANVEPDYSYVNDTNEYGWGSNITRIATQAITENSANPDIYCNFAYDLTCAQVRGCFANLLSTSYDGGNWFRFTESGYNPTSDNYFDAEAGEGYFYQYMQSLSLSDDKVYCLASNYCTDTVRSFLVVPVNVSMLEDIKPENQYVDSITNITAFYDLVWRNSALNEKYAEGWTYNVLAHYGNKVYVDDTSSDNVLADTVAFAAGTNSGLVSSGILYTTSVKIIDRKANGDGTYTFSYPENNTNLNEFAEALQTLFGKNKPAGIITVSGEDAKAYTGRSVTELVAIRENFASNKILFGGVIAVGSLEEEVYQKMRTDGKGFGILPVPLYRSSDEYLTLVHNIARIIAIAKATTDFAQCSAFLDYNSRMSAEILDEYYEGTLVSSTGGLAGNANKDMLTYIRNHVRDCFDKTFEDAVSARMSAVDDNSTSNKWHEILSRNKFDYADFSAQYKSMREAKEEALAKVLEDWESFN